MVTWYKGSDYPDIESLAKAYRAKKSDCTKSMVVYACATIVLTGALYFASREWLVLLGGFVAIITIWGWMALRWRTYRKMSSIVCSENFSWTTGKVQNRWRRQMLDLNSGSMYQVGLCDEWVACDMTTYNQSEIGKIIVLIESKNIVRGLMLPKNESPKKVKRIARNAS